MRLGGIALALAVISGCDSAEAPRPPDVRPVRVVAVQERTGAETVALTGVIRAEREINLAFRIDGRMIERYVDVGDFVEAGQVVARLDPKDEENAVRSARAALAAATGRLREARNNYERQAELLRVGFTTRVRYDEALQNFQTAQAQVDAEQANLRIAENRLSFTSLVAEASGVVTARGAEPGEVVQPGRMILQIARDEGRDAVFDVPEQIMRTAPPDPLIQVSLTMEPSITAMGRVREVAPRADPVTGTFQVKVALIDPPEEMRLGSVVSGRMQLGAFAGIELPASALTRVDNLPAVWVVDPATQTVSLRPVEVARFDPAVVVVSQGLQVGEIVVTAGVHALRPGQKVRLLGGAA